MNPLLRITVRGTAEGRSISSNVAAQREALFMRPEPTAEALVQLVHRHYPVGLCNEDPQYAQSDEGRRLKALLQTHVNPSPAWKEFMLRLSRELPDCWLWDTTVPSHDPCYECRVSLPGFQVGDPLHDCVVCMLSKLAPVYALYASHSDRSAPGGYWMGFPLFPTEFQSLETKLAALIESTFGFTGLPNDVLFTLVPDLVPRTANYGPGQAQLIDCLFTRHRW